jgi:hypothetical protein
MEKIGRNDPCPCGSGKKFKKCCESKMIGKRFAAHKIEDQSQANKAAGLSNLFKSRVEKPADEPKSPEPPPPEKP